MHTTWLLFYSKTTIRHYPIFPQASPKLSSLHTQGETSSLHEVTSILVLDMVKNAFESSFVARHLFPHPTTSFLPVI